MLTWRQAPPPDSKHNLSTLPYDILLSILKQLDSFRDLRELLLTARVFPQVFIINPNGVCSSIARREYPEEALQVLNLWRPGGMKPFARRHLMYYHTQPSGGPSRLLLGEEDTLLNRDPSIIGLEEAKRLAADRRFVRYIRGLFNTATNSRDNNMRPFMGRVWVTYGYEYHYSEDECSRIQRGIYSALLLAPAFHSRRVADRGGETVDVNRLSLTDVLIDWTHLLRLPLESHICLLAISHQFTRLWPWLRETYGGHPNNPSIPTVAHMLYLRLRGKNDWRPEKWASNKKARRLSEKYDKYAGYYIWDQYNSWEQHALEYKKWLENEEKANEYVLGLIEKKKEQIHTINEEGAVEAVTVVLK